MIQFLYPFVLYIVLTIILPNIDTSFLNEIEGKKRERVQTDVEYPSSASLLSTQSNAFAKIILCQNPLQFHTPFSQLTCLDIKTENDGNECK